MNTNELLLFLWAIVLGLIIGSFLNVVIHRLPIMLQRQWHEQCSEWLIINSSVSITKSKKNNPLYNLAFPYSHCPQCLHSLRWFENIPLVSFIYQHRCCRHCGGKISWRYPLVELATALMSGLIVYHFGFTLQGGMGLIFIWLLIPLAIIDLEHQLLPDNLTLLLLWLGLLRSLYEPTLSPSAAIVGAIVGYLFLWLIYWLVKILTAKEGMGYGDFKLLAALGSWLGWSMLPLVVLIASLTGAITGIILITKGRDRQQPIPFGPFLAGAGAISFLWGKELMAYYQFWGF